MPKKIVLIPLITVACMFAFFAYVLVAGVDPKLVPSALTGKAFPDFKLTVIDSERDYMTRDDIVGEPMLVNVWATWCTSCKYEHPFLNTLAAQGIRIIGLNYKDDRQLAIDWLRDYADPYSDNLYDPNGDLGFDLGVTGAPETFFVDSKGNIMFRFQGPIDSRLWEEKLKAVYDELV